MVEVKLLGELGRCFGRSYRFMARNPREIISALANQLDGFTNYMMTAHENGIGFKLVNKDPAGMDYDGILVSCEKLVIAPIVSGAGGNGVSIGQILIGAALVGLSFVSFGGAAFAGIAAGSKAIGSTLLFSLGASMVLTGIAGLLTPPVQTPDDDSKKRDSFMFDRAVELTTQGLPVPLLYGRYLAVAPLVISSSISTKTIPV